MADPLPPFSDHALRTLAQHSKYDALREVAAELLAARAERNALRAEVERLRFVIRSYLAWRNDHLDDSGADEFHAALSALRAAAEEPKP